MLPTADVIGLGIVSLGVRAAIGLWGYSGAGQGPMFGDFEAQRHWMEITTALPLGEWYKNTADNDLQYWGLDYPPLTAYVSYLYGLLARAANISELVELHASRGHESENGKAFMRGSVLIADLCVLIPATILTASFLCKVGGGSTSSSSNQQLQHRVFTLIALLCPGLLLIDHGHFQYNGVCIGLTLLAACAILKDRYLIGSVLFCLSMNFKQMSLYYSPVFFFCLLRKCLERADWKQQIILLVKIGLSVLISFAVLWFPFCVYHHKGDTCVVALLQVLHRQFPFSRGIFEDKVANIWYSLSVVVDFRELMSIDALVKCCLSLTLLLLAPTGVYLLTHEVTARTFLLALTSSSLAFFLASYQVHEKSILLALVPSSFLISDSPLLIGWFQVLGCFSMFPLLQKDGLSMPYILCLVGYLTLVDIYCVSRDNSETSSIYTSPVPRDSSTSSVKSFYESAVVLSNQYKLVETFISLSALGMLVLHAAECTISPPAHLPHIYPALFSIYSALNLCVAYVGVVLTMWFREQAIDGNNKTSYSSKKID